VSLQSLENHVLSQLSNMSEARAILLGLRRQQVMNVVRGATFVAALLLVWISLHPFTDLGNVLLSDLTNGNESQTYAAFGCLAVLMMALVIRDNMPGLKSLLSPGYILFGGWVAVTVILSLDPGASVRRFVLSAGVITVAATLMLLPKTQNELMRWFSIAALGLLAACYLGLILAPNLSMHLATDAQEPALAGDWRGSFGHKNMAAAVMVMVLFIGIYVARSGAWISGVAIVALAALFILNSGGKSSFALSLAVVGLTSLMTVIRPCWLRAAITLAPLVLLNLLTIGSVVSDQLAEISSLLPVDTSFTGRTDIWTFGLQAAQARPWTGYGFAAFWGSDSVKNLPEGMEWAATAAHSHNGYLDSTLTMGLPGLALVIAVLVIAPLRNFQLAEAGGNNGPLAMMLLRIWLFGIYLSSLESFFFDRDDPIWFTFLVAIFGLHYLARFRATA
jgi:O-antigen ligase